MREAILKVYTGISWQSKVLKMENRQVVAIYKDFERNGRLQGLQEWRNRPRKGWKCQEEPEIYCRQMSIWDLKDEKGEKTCAVM